MMTSANKLEALARKALEISPSDFDWTLESVIDDGNFLKVRDKTTGQVQLIDAHRFLFLHKTARALFSEKYTYMHDGYRRFKRGDTLVASNLDPRIPAFSAIEDKSFWTGGVSYEPYQYHLQQAVISDDPISYMYEKAIGDV